jgi:hypothetical protein
MVASSGSPVGTSPWAHLHSAFSAPFAPGYGNGVGECLICTPSLAQPNLAHCFSSSRELKYRAGRQANEPSFQIRDYVESQKKRSSCCSFV